MTIQKNPKRCPTCDSPAPHLHPAVQFEGEVSICKDVFHSIKTPQNRNTNLDRVSGNNSDLRGKGSLLQGKG